MFGNKYKDWLATPVEFIEGKDARVLYLPSVYLEDIKKICDDYIKSYMSF